MRQEAGCFGNPAFCLRDAEYGFYAGFSILNHFMMKTVKGKNALVENKFILT